MSVNILKIIFDYPSERLSLPPYLDDYKNKEKAFLIIVAPVIEKIYNSLTLNIEQEKTRKAISAMIKLDMNKYLFNILGRICILQMHYLVSKNIISEGEKFHDFIKFISIKNNVLILFNRFPILVNRLNIFFTNYINAKREFLERFINDTAEIINFNKKKSTHTEDISIKQIVSTSDIHSKGKSVLIIDFCANSIDYKIVYKPRDCSVIDSFNFFIKKYNKYANHNLFPLEIINKKNYAWIKYIEGETCNTTVQIENYYRRFGSLTVILFLLNGIDFHSENVIAHSEYPILIDLECIFHPQMANHHAPHILDSMMLPLHSQDYSALGHLNAVTTPLKFISISETTIKKSTKKNYHNKNIPTLNYQKVDPHKYLNFVIEGAKTAYNAIQKNKQVFIDLIQSFAGKKTRVILRPTLFYYKFIEESAHPSIILSQEKTNLFFSQKIDGKKLFEAEKTDLFNLEIPYFSTKIDGQIIYSSNKKKFKLKTKKELTQVIENIDNMSDSQLREIISIITSLNSLEH